MTDNEEEELIPDIPENRRQGWITFAISFSVLFVLNGIFNSYGIIYTLLVNRFKTQGKSDIYSSTALVGSLGYGIFHLMCPISGIMVDSLGHRKTALLGGMLATVGILSSAFSIDYPAALYVTFATMFGIGASLQVVSAVSCLGLFFKHKMGLVTGFTFAGGALFATVLPLIINAIVPIIELRGFFIMLAGFLMIVSISAIAIKPPIGMVTKVVEPSLFKRLVYMENWRNRKYIIWCLTFPVTYFGFFTPYVHLVEYASTKFPDSDAHLLLTVLNIASFFSRIYIGFIGDLKRVNKISLQQVTILISGVFIMLIPVITSWTWLIILTLGIGLVNGGFVSLSGPIAFQLCGLLGGTQAYGFAMGLVSIYLTAGPAIAGLFYDKTQSYMISFLLSGGVTVIAAISMSAIYIVKNNRQSIINNNESENYQTLAEEE